MDLQRGLPGTKWVLVVDDDHDNRETLLDVLDVAGYSATGASSGAGALALLRAERPCLVVSDFIMRDMDGKELFLASRRLLDGGAPPFIFVTGAHPAVLGELSCAVLAKPLDIDELLRAVAQHCGPPGPPPG